MSRWRASRAAGLVGVTGLLLVLLAPRPCDVAAALRHPLTWATAAGPDQTALALASLCSWLLLLWLAAGSLLTIAATVPGATGRAAEALACGLLPGSVRRIVVGVVGLSLTTSVAACGGAGPTKVAATIGPERAVAAPTPPAVASRDPTTTYRSVPRSPDAASSDASRGIGVGVDWPIGASTMPSPASNGHPAEPNTPLVVRPTASTGGVTSTSPRPTAGSVTTVEEVPPSAAVPASRAPRSSDGSSSSSGATSTPARRRRSQPDEPVPTAPTTRPTTTPDADRSAAAAGGPRSRRPLTVHQGDCLWLIAARRLGPEATTAEIHAETQRWYAVNAGVIGPDPDYLRPGEVLTTPPGQRS